MRWNVRETARAHPGAGRREPSRWWLTTRRWRLCTRRGGVAAGGAAGFAFETREHSNIRFDTAAAVLERLAPALVTQLR